MRRIKAGLRYADKGQTIMPNRENIATRTSAFEGWVFIGICLFGFAATVFVVSLS
jgi:hypothetical protein